MDGREDNPTSTSVSDRMDPARAAALHAVLGLPGRPPVDGEALPPFFHQVYFWDVRPPDALGHGPLARPRRPSTIRGIFFAVFARSVIGLASRTVWMHWGSVISHCISSKERSSIIHGR